MDRISALPDETIVHILSFLPVDAAARTSILSRRWRCLWTLNTALNIHASDSKPINYPVIFSRIIPKYQSPNLHKFSLIFDPVKSVSHPSFGLDHLFAFVLSRGLRGLSLGIGRYQYPFRYVDLPRPFYLQGRSLQEVFLSWVNFCSPADVGFRELASLTELSLSYSSVCDETVSLLLSSCPLLEGLRIDQCWGLHVVSITAGAGPCSLRRLKHLSFCWSSLEEGEGKKLIVQAPNLVSLKYKGDLMKLELGSLPCLDQVGLSGTWAGKLDYHHVDNLLEKVGHSRVFYTASWFAKYLSFKYKFGGGKLLGCSTIPTYFRNLRTFSWVGFLTSDCDLGTLMAFFADCPSLETVVMDLSFCWGSHAFVSRFELIEHCSGDKAPEESVAAGGIMINGLKRVQVNDFYGSEREMKFLKLVLERASVLELLVVNFQSLQGPAAQDQKKKVEEQLCLWPVASAHVQIVFR